MAVREILKTSLIDDTHTGDTNWTDVASGSLTGFTTGEVYWILAWCKITGSSSGQSHGFRLYDINAAAAIARTQTIRESIGNDHEHYMCSFRWTANASGLKAQIRIDSASATVDIEDLIIVAINIDDLTAGTDYEYNENDTTDSGWGNSSWSSTNLPVVTVDGVSGDKWLIVGMHTIEPNNTNVNYYSSIWHGSSSPATILMGTDGLSTPTGNPQSFEGEDNTDECIAVSVAWYDFTATESRNFYMRHGGDGNIQTSQKTYGNIFAINMDGANFCKEYSVASDLTDDNAISSESAPGDTVDVVSHTPTQTGDVVYLGFHTSNAPAVNARGSILYTQVGGGGYSANPTGQNTGDQNPMYDGHDHNEHFGLYVYNLTSTSQFDVRTSTWTNDNTESPVWNQFRGIIFSAELPAAPSTGVRLQPKKVHEEIAV